MPIASKETDWQSLAVLRFFLAWVVLSSHLNVFAEPAAWVRAFDAFGGKAAVMGFLLVSGYSIAASLERGHLGFYRRRFLRIYPLYGCALLFAGVLQFTAGDPSRLHLPETVNGGWGWLTLVGNFFMVQTFVVKPLAFDGPVWSLAIEVSFYALAPLFARMRPGYLMALVIFSAGCYSLPQHADWGFVYHVLSKLNALCYLWCWLLGFLLRFHPARSVVILAALGVVPVLVGRVSGRLDWLTYLISLLVILAATRTRMPAAFRRIADYLGELSYPLYLMHFPSFVFGFIYLGGVLSPFQELVLALSTTIVSYHVVDGFLKPRFLVPLVLGQSARPAAAGAAAI